MKRRPQIRLPPEPGTPEPGPTWWTRWEHGHLGMIFRHAPGALYEAVKRRDLSWRLGLVADRGRHEITTFDAPCFQRNNIQFICAGENLRAMYGFRFIRSTAELPVDAQTNASEFQVNDEGLLVWVGPGNSYTQGETSQLWGTNATIGSASYQWGMPITLKDAGGSAAVVKPVLHDLARIADRPAYFAVLSETDDVVVTVVEVLPDASAVVNIGVRTNVGSSLASWLPNDGEVVSETTMRLENVTVDTSVCS